MYCGIIFAPVNQIVQMSCSVISLNLSSGRLAVLLAIK
jgi:hypothetical protein